jgi:hypothetical protein
MHWDTSEILVCITNPHCPKQFKAKDIQSLCEDVYGYHICPQDVFYHIYKLLDLGTLTRVNRGLYTLSILDESVSTMNQQVQVLKELKEQADNAKERLETLELELSIAKQIKAQTESAFHQAYQEFVTERMFQVNQEIGNVEILILPIGE